MIDTYSRTYYTECRGLQMFMKLDHHTLVHDPFPEIIPSYPCLNGKDCPAGGTHDLLPISNEQADELMADEEDGC